MSKATDSASSKLTTKSSNWNVGVSAVFKTVGAGASAQGSKSKTENNSSSNSRAFSKSEKSEEFQNKMSSESVSVNCLKYFLLHCCVKETHSFFSIIAMLLLDCIF